MTEPAKPTREERLAAQLRANLRRRKAQAREMNAGRDGVGLGLSKDEPPS